MPETSPMQFHSKTIYNERPQFEQSLKKQQVNKVNITFTSSTATSNYQRGSQLSKYKAPPHAFLSRHPFLMHQTARDISPQRLNSKIIEHGRQGTSSQEKINVSSSTKASLPLYKPYAPRGPVASSSQITRGGAAPIRLVAFPQTLDNRGYLKISNVSFHEQRPQDAIFEPVYEMDSFPSRSITSKLKNSKVFNKRKMRGNFGYESR